MNCEKNHILFDGVLMYDIEYSEPARGAWSRIDLYSRTNGTPLIMSKDTGNGIELVLGQRKMFLDYGDLLDLLIVLHEQNKQCNNDVPTKLTNSEKMW